MIKRLVLVLDILGQAATSCRSNPLRTVLSGFAVAAAVATVAVVIVGLEGVQQSAKVTSARAFGSDTFVVTRVATGQKSRRELADLLARNPLILRSDTRFLDRYAEDQVVYSPIIQRRGDIVFRGRKFEAASINGAEATMFQIRDLGIERGRFFRPSESVGAAQVAVLGAEVVDVLFPGEEALGKKIRIAGRAFQVIGIQSRQGSAGGVSLDRYVWIPIRAYERAFGAAESLQVFAKAADPGETLSAEDRTRMTMRARRQLRPGAADNFEIISPEAARGFVLALSQRISVAAAPISFMALLAAIVVVTNTTLVSVTQRVREIGIRRAVGAARARIAAEVLTESSLISLLGGAAGLGIAWLVLSAAGQFLSYELPLTASTVGWSLAASALSGIVAGWYPARWASRIDVINALRVE